MKGSNPSIHSVLVVDDERASRNITKLILREDQLEFVALASVLAGRHLMEVTGPLTPRRYGRCLDFYKLEQEQLDQLTECVRKDLERET